MQNQFEPSNNNKISDNYNNHNNNNPFNNDDNFLPSAPPFESPRQRVNTFPYYNPNSYLYPESYPINPVTKPPQPFPSVLPPINPDFSSNAYYFPMAPSSPIPSHSNSYSYPPPPFQNAPPSYPPPQQTLNSGFPPPTQGGYPPPSYSPQNSNFPPMQGGYPPPFQNSPSSYPQSSHLPQGSSNHPSQQTYPPSYPPQGSSNYPPPQQSSYPPPQSSYSSQQQPYLPQQTSYPPPQGSSNYPPPQPSNSYPHPPQQSNLPPYAYTYPPQTGSPMTPQPQQGTHLPPTPAINISSGKKKALFIGINYFGSSSQLRGPINDISNMKKFLINRFKWPNTPECILTLSDDQTEPRKIPTKFNMIAGMKWLVKDAKPGDVLFFHYSGHGSQVKDKDGDEEDGFDETILPVDFVKSGPLVDDDMHDILVKPLAKGVKMVVIFDSCHSGTALDLPYVYNVQGELDRSDLVYDKPFRKTDLVVMGLEVLLTGKYTKKKKKANKAARERTIQTKSSPADVIMFSSSRDDQVSMDTALSGVGHIGAMSYAIIESFNRNSSPTYRELLVLCRNILKPKFSQIPQLSCCHEIDVNQLFSL